MKYRHYIQSPFNPGRKHQAGAIDHGEFRASRRFFAMIVEESF